MFPVRRLVGQTLRLQFGPAAWFGQGKRRRKQLRRLQRHLDDVLVAVQPGAGADVAAEDEDIHGRRAKGKVERAQGMCGLHQRLVWRGSVTSPGTETLWTSGGLVLIAMSPA